jgi:hypothetical protein
MRKPSAVALAIVFISALFLFSYSTQARQQSDKSSAPSAKQQAKATAEADIKLGDSARKNHSLHEAIADYKAAILADPSNQDAHEKFLRAYGQKVDEAFRPKATRKSKKKLTKAQQDAQKAKEERRQKQLDAKRKKLETKTAAKLLATYDQWIRKNPQQPMFYWGKAQILEDQDKNTEARQLLHKAIEVDPSCAAAYADLSELAAVDGNVAEQREDAEKALALDPKDSSGVFWNYSLTYLTTDPAKYRQIVEDRVAKYPQGLEYLLVLVAENVQSPEEQEAVYQKLYRIYGPKSAHPSENINDIMVDAFNLYARSDPAKALAFADQMRKDEAEAEAQKAAAEAKTKKDSGEQANKDANKGDAKKADAEPPKSLWQAIGDFQKSIVQAQSFIAQKKYSEAQALLDKGDAKPTKEFDPLSGVDKAPYELAKAQALALSGQTQKAYSSIQMALLPKPDDSLRAALVSYGAKLGKTPAQVRQELWQVRESQAKPFAPFDLKQYVTNKEVKLADYRGRVVLVNFWFPG